MKALWLGTLLVCAGVPNAGAERQNATKPKRDSRMLVEPEQLWKALNDPNLRILDVRSLKEYSAGHVAGAVRVDVAGWKTLAAASRGLHDAKRWAETIGSLGITSKSRVVVYGGRLTDAARVWWLLKYVGLKQVSLLNGGWESWAMSDALAQTSTPKLKATTFKPVFQADRLAEIDLLKKSLKTGRLRAVDARSDGEFAGGRIPGAAHLEWKELVAKDGRFKTESQLRQLFRKRGIKLDETAVCY